MKDWTEREKINYWLGMFPSGSFWCTNCKQTYELIPHRRAQREEGKAPNLCKCGALLTLEAFDSEGVAARRGARGATHGG